MPKFRKKPVVIEAIQWNGNNNHEFSSFCPPGKLKFHFSIIKDDPNNILIDTLDGEMKALPGDWIIKGVNGEFYPCKPDIFEKTYEAVIEEEKMIRNKWHKIGEIGVDAGLVWIGDPCYILHKTKKEQPKDIGKSWREFIDKLMPNEKPKVFQQFNYDLGHPGLGICFTSGWGDGIYDVEAKYYVGDEDKDHKRIAEIRIKFIEE
jgi:hypothetical protein